LNFIIFLGICSTFSHVPIKFVGVVVTLYTRILEILCSNLGRTTGYPDWGLSLSTGLETWLDYSHFCISSAFVLFITVSLSTCARQFLLPPSDAVR
jgi:hypothetical protein